MTAFTLRKALTLRNVPFFYFCSPGLGLRVLAFAVWASSWLEWGLPLVEASGESLGRGRAFFDQLVLPDSRALGAGLPGTPGSWSLELLPPFTFRLRAATVATPVRHTLRHPCFPLR